MAATTAGLILASTQVAQAGVTAASEYGQARYASSADRINARRALQEAQSALERGDLDAAERMRAAKQLAGRQRAVAAASGVSVEGGDISDITSETRTLGQLDAATIRANAYRRAFGFKTEASDLERQAKMRMMGARFGAATTLLMGGMKAAGTIYDNRTGPRAKTPKFEDPDYFYRGY